MQPVEYVLYDIAVVPIVPPLAGAQFAAHAIIVGRDSSGRIVKTVVLHDHHGITREEAERKAQREADDWLRSPPAPAPTGCTPPSSPTTPAGPPRRAADARRRSRPPRRGRR